MSCTKHNASSEATVARRQAPDRVPKGVTVTSAAARVDVKGPKGKLALDARRRVDRQDATASAVTS